jgi:methylmalonyl-CoA mutase N-terminal domain/subunit
VERALAALGEAAKAVVTPGATAPHLMPLIIDAVKARATVGEVSATLAQHWGKHRPRA